MPVRAAMLRAIALSCLLLLIASAATAQGAAAAPDEARASSMASAAAPPGPYTKVCGLRGKDLGKLVEKGPGKWKLYDTVPGSTAARAFHLTGFADGCPRRILGAVAMFGSVELYELIQFGGVGADPRVGDTDQAYAKLRAKSCGAARPCSERGLRSLAKTTAFVNVYPRKGSASRLEMLMNRGRIAAVSMK